MTYFNRTTFGDSKRSYGRNQEKSFQGTCQGNLTSPAIWLLIPVCLVILIKEEVHECSIRAPMSGSVLTIVGFPFVDDTNLVVMGEKKDEKTAVNSILQQAINF